MKTTKLTALAVLLIAAGTFLAAQAQEHPTQAEHPSGAEHANKAEHPADRDNIVAIASDAGEFKTLVAAIKAAGLVETLQGKGPFTVFAPTDDAFAQLPAGTLEDLLEPANKAQLAGLLASHVVPGKIMAADMKTMKATNVSGQDLDIRVADGAVTVGNAHVVQADLVASNGVIHAIDAVIVSIPAGEAAASDKPKDHPAH